MGHYGKHDRAVGPCECDECTGDKGEKQRVVELLQQGNGTNVPEISEDLNVPRKRAREILREINESRELGSSMDFRYKLVGKE